MDIQFTFQDRGYQRVLDSLAEAQDHLDTALDDYRRQGYLVTEKSVDDSEVALWNLNLNGKDVGTVGIVKGDVTPEEEW